MKLIDDEDVKKLESIKKRLFNGDRLTFDERRDLAKILDSILRNLVEDDFQRQSTKTRLIRTLCYNELTKISGEDEKK